MRVVGSCSGVRTRSSLARWLLLRRTLNEGRGFHPLCRGTCEIANDLGAWLHRVMRGMDGRLLHEGTNKALLLGGTDGDHDTLCTSASGAA